MVKLIEKRLKYTTAFLCYNKLARSVGKSLFFLQVKTAYLIEMRHLKLELRRKKC